MSEVLTHPLSLPVLGTVLVLVLLATGLSLYRRRKNRRHDQQFRKVAHDVLTDILIPNIDDGEISIEYAMLTHQGIVIVDVKDVEGNVFGSDSMQDWTVISDDRRFTFGNPQFALYDRLAAIRRLVTNVPVSGYVVFTNRSQFSKGQPSDVIAMDALLSQLKDQCAAEDRALLEQWLPHWDSLRETAVSTQVGNLLRH